MPTRRARHRPRHRPGPRLVAFLRSAPGQVALASALVVLLAAAVLALVLGDDPTDGVTADRDRPAGLTTPPPAGPTTPAASTPGTSAPGSSGTPAAALLDFAGQELPDRTRLRPEDAVRDDLVAAGAPDELVGTDAPTGPGDLVLTVTEGPAAPGSRVVARFGDLALVDPSPGTPTPEQLASRQALAEAVLANPTTRVAGDAAGVLRSADVDMRLLSLLAVLTAREGLAVAAFPRAEGAEGPARDVLLTAVGSAPVGSDRPATEPLRTWLEAQLPPFAPDRVEVTGDGVLLSYDYASAPDALVAEVSP
ncbi:hypothetical protein [Geodermatophilus sp. DSM 45219]|uniref:hypothetical protein n=1 Tax=Geodermatophilus sp. DSM 45219 TaxID=1881103 RepID=UPI000882A491|nr:hypothetical protein [Geodermatophilus sp. DSM 45219]SDO28927.1 hypothetical protein SAMN05428965_3356 [Geodermatophilus sp. DSM 45219]